VTGSANKRATAVDLAGDLSNNWVIGRVFMQTLVSVYLAAIAAAGPWLCCCAGDFVAHKPVRTGSVEHPTPKQLPSCCQHKQENPTPAGDQPSAPSKCSCEQHRPDAILTASDSSQGPTVTAFVAFDAALSLPSCLPLTQTITSRESLTPPSHSPGDILRTLHILLC
jgi:hypothetical protein